MLCLSTLMWRFVFPLNCGSSPVYFWTYERDFLSQYCQAWVKLELDTHLAQQALREALDSKEVQEARERLNHITELSHVRSLKQSNSTNLLILQSCSCCCKILISVFSKLKNSSFVCFSFSTPLPL